MIKPRCPTLQADSLPAEPRGKPKNTGVGILSLLQGNVPTRESNRGLLPYRQILYRFGVPEINNFPLFVSRPFPVSACCISSLISCGALPLTIRWELVFFHPMFCLGADSISDSFLGKSVGKCLFVCLFVWDIAFPKISLFCTYIWLAFWLDIGFLVRNNFSRISMKLLHYCLVSIVSAKTLLFTSLYFQCSEISWWIKKLIKI